MDVFNALWDNPEQKKRPANDDFQMFSAEEWTSHSSTYKILSGNFTCPLPPEIEGGKGLIPKIPKTAGVGSNPKHNGHQKNTQKQGSDLTEGSHRFREYIPGLVPLPSFTRMSSLSQEEHRDCLRLYQKFCGISSDSMTVADRTEYQLFVCLCKRVAEEQKEYMEFAKSHWNEYAYRTTKLKTDAKNFVEQLWMAQVRHALARYPKKYSNLKILSLPHEKRPAIKVCFAKNLLNIGRVPLVRLPQLDKPYRVATKTQVLRSWALLNIQKRQTAGTLHKVPVSADPNAERLAHLNGAHIVISASGLKCLLDIYEGHQGNSSRCWKLPVIIKGYRSFENGHPVTRNVVFIDKALPPTGMTGLEKVSKYHKHALLAAVVDRTSKEGINFEIKGEDINFKKCDSDPRHPSPSSIPCEKLCLSNSSLQSETFNYKESVCLEPSSANQFSSTPSSSGKNPNENICSDLDSDDNDDECKLVIDTQEVACEESKSSSSNQFRPTHSSSSPQNPNRNISSDIGNDDSGDECKLVIDTEEAAHEHTLSSTDDFRCSTSGNSYLGRERNSSKGIAESVQRKQLSEVTVRSVETVNEVTTQQISLVGKDSTSASNEPDQSSAPPVKIVNGHALPLGDTNVTYNLWTMNKENSSNSLIKLLVRNHVQGCVSLGNQKYQHICLECKPEFQLEFGAEAVPLRELSRQWTGLFFQPGADLVRVRVNAESSEMILVEKKSTTELTNEIHRLYGVDITDTFSVIHSVFFDLLSLQSGQYLLSFNSQPGKEAELSIQTSVDGSESFDLSLEYGKSPSSIQCEAPWQTLDTSVILPSHNVFRRMPCCFVAQRKREAKPKQIRQKQPPCTGRTLQKPKSKNKKKKKKKKLS